MQPLTIYEFDKIVAAPATGTAPGVPARVFAWLEDQCLGRNDQPQRWLRPSRDGGRRAIQITSYVGVIRAPGGFQIEVLPKIGRKTSAQEARARLLDMLRCLRGFRHIRSPNADLDMVRMPLLEIFIQQFLDAVAAVVKRGLRSDYVSRQDNLFTLRGKLLVARHLTRNSARRERFLTEHDEFSADRAENRLIHTALRQVLSLSHAPQNQRAARELGFVFADVPLSTDVARDLQRIRLDRGMSYYQAAVDWTRLILQGLSPVSAAGRQHAPSLLFPMEALFEAYVEKHLRRQLRQGFSLKAQASGQHLISHRRQAWFRLKPDLLIKQQHNNRLVLDAKWKLLDAGKDNGSDKYGLSQADLYQLYAYGHHYLHGNGDVVLIYPKTDTFIAPLPVFEFPEANGMRLWVLPFCLACKRLLLPGSEPISTVFVTHSNTGLTSPYLPPIPPTSV